MKRIIWSKRRYIPWNLINSCVPCNLQTSCQWNTESAGFGLKRLFRHNLARLQGCSELLWFWCFSGCNASLKSIYMFSLEPINHNEMIGFSNRHILSSTKFRGRDGRWLRRVRSTKKTKQEGEMSQSIRNSGEMRNLSQKV
jgi:hypothetical protein